MTNIVPIEILFRGQPELIDATRELVQGAMLDSVGRGGQIYVLWDGLRDKPFKLVGGFIADNQMYLRLQSSKSVGLLYVCDLPTEYEGNPVTSMYPFDKEDIKRVLAANGTNWTREEHYLDE